MLGRFTITSSLRSIASPESECIRFLLGVVCSLSPVEIRLPTEAALDSGAGVVPAPDAVL
jgi:hypothetical protein